MIFLLKTLFYIDLQVAAGLLLFRWALPLRRRDIVSGKLAGIALTTPAVALFCGNVNYYYLYLIAVVAFNSRSRTELAGVFVFLLPSAPLLATETTVGGVYLFAVSTLGAMGIGALLGTAMTPRRARPMPMRYDVAIVALVGIFLFIDHRDFGPTGLLRGLALNVVTFVGPYMLVSRAARDLADVERLLLRLSLGATIMAVTACFQAWRHWVLFETYYQALHVRLPMISAALSLRAGLLRTGGSMVDYSAGGLFLATIVTLLPLLHRAFRRSGFWAVMATLVCGLIATQSRGAWAAAIVGLIFLAAWRGQWGRVTAVVASAVMAEILVTLFVRSGRLAEILGKTGDARGTATYRQDLFRLGIQQVESHPLLGQPPESLVRNLNSLVQGEHIVDFVNSHLFVAMAAGVPIFVIWCVIWLMPVVEGWQRRSRSDPLTAAPSAIIVPALIALTFTSLGERNLTWPVIAVALAGPCIAAGRTRRRPTPRGSDQLEIPAAPPSARPVSAR